MSSINFYFLKKILIFNFSLFKIILELLKILVKIRVSTTLNKATNGLSKKIFYFDNLLKINKLATCIFFLLILIGIFNLLTISYTHAIRQIIFLISFLPICALIVCINPRYIIRLSYVSVIFSILLLILIFIVGDISMGARRWINLGLFKFQPSEISKIIVVLAIARYYHFLKEHLIDKLKYSMIPMLIILSQVVFILKQPDLGTSLTIFLIGISMIFLAGLQLRYFIITGILGLLMIPLIWGNLHDYQKKRIMTFLNPDEDTLGTGYNIIQAKIAIGSGGIIGKGAFAGTQGTLDFLPESHTDFAFTIFAEQYGFAGCLALILIYGILIAWGMRISLKSESHFIRLASSGITLLFSLHIIINLAMTSGLIPVVGNPLPLISYGGTFLIANLICFALLLNFDVNKFLVIHSTAESYMEK